MYKNIKIRITDETSAAVQKHLFESGCKWRHGGASVKKYSSMRFIYLDDSGFLTQGGSEDYFLEDSRPEFTVSVAKVKLLPSSDVITIAGKTYFKHEVDRALEGLEEVYIAKEDEE